MLFYFSIRGFERVFGMQASIVRVVQKDNRDSGLFGFSCILFVAHVENPKQVVILSKQNNFRYPIFFDKKGVMGKLNKFPDSYQFKTFLLNEKKEVVLMGTPIGNDELWRLYKEVIISGIK